MLLLIKFKANGKHETYGTIVKCCNLKKQQHTRVNNRDKKYLNG